MKRCIQSSLIALALIAGTAFAQGLQRSAPANVTLARMVVTAPPQVTLDGKPDRLSPGSRIHDLNNMTVLSGGIVGKDLPIVYRRDTSGLVHEVWLLSDEEYSKLGGLGAGGDAQGHKRFDDLLAAIFGARR